MIRFTCPNGHRLSIKESAAGKPGKCPNCNSKFLVPELEDAEQAPPEEDMIVFLCPNGHRLNGPKSLQGKAGQCPHCGSKFHIPNYDEPLAEEDDEIVEDVEELEEVTEELSEMASVGTSSLGPGDNAQGHAAVESQADPVPAAQPGGSSVEQSSQGVSRARQTAAAFLRFWRGRRDPEKVEIGFSGKSLVVHFFDISSVETDIGRFAVRQDDGKHSVFHVAWNDITHVAKIDSKRLPVDFTS